MQAGLELPALLHWAKENEVVHTAVVGCRVHPVAQGVRIEKRRRDQFVRTGNGRLCKGSVVSMYGDLCGGNQGQDIHGAC